MSQNQRIRQNGSNRNPDILKFQFLNSNACRVELCFSLGKRNSCFQHEMFLVLICCTVENSQLPRHVFNGTFQGVCVVHDCVMCIDKAAWSKEFRDFGILLTHVDLYNYMLKS